MRAREEVCGAPDQGNRKDGENLVKERRPVREPWGVWVEKRVEELEAAS